jgi:1,4-alpha-glucan branching enzyme
MPKKNKMKESVIVINHSALISPSQIDSLVYSDCDDIFGLLGQHKQKDGQFVVRVFLPNADEVELIELDSNKVITQLHPVRGGVFVGLLPTNQPCDYRLRVRYDEHIVIKHDPYRFGSTIRSMDLYLFGEGTHERLYDWLGAHLVEIDGVSGVRFCVWAPNARRVSVVGDFNFWDGRHHIMRKHVPSGVWEIFIPELTAGVAYKYEIKAREGHLLPHKSDPMGFYAERAPQTASRVVDVSDYIWNDQEWMSNRKLQAALDRPISIYEVHLGSWRRSPDHPTEFLSYRDLAEQLVDYVKTMNFTHIQLMPVSEFPFDGSWGYQPIGLFAPTSRFGTPQDFMYLIDRCHQAGIGILIDWVPGHFPSDGHGLARFDGTPLYEHADDRQGFHPDWNTYIYNYGRCEVANFLYSNALFWLDRFHIDGLRVDAVASMLYLDYSRNEGEWIPNRYGGRENLEAIDLLKRTNQKVYERFPDVMMVAEESTAWPGVSHPVYAGGLGFGFKWNMGWMNDTLRYMANDPIHRQYHHHDMTFSLLYAFSENFILPLSHDEVVHGKRSLLDKMPGYGPDKFANLRAYFGYMWTHPGKKLLFMGGEFAQGREWNHDYSLDWHLLALDPHQGVQRLVQDLNRLYVASPALHNKDCSPEGFEWIEADDRHNSVFAYMRKAPGYKPMIAISNFTPVHRDSYRIGVPCEGFYRERFNSDSSIYGGKNNGNAGGCQAQRVSSQGREWSLVINLAPLSTVIFEMQ